MNYHFYENKIIYMLMSALVLIQLTAYIALKHHNEAVIESTIKADLTTGSQVFKRLLAARHQQLTQSAHLLVGDFGFRESIASMDIPTIESTLINHGSRADAAFIMLTDLDHEVIAATSDARLNAILDTPQPHIIEETINTKTPQFFRIPRELEQKQPHTNTAKKSYQLVQLVSASIASPLPIATLTLGHLIDDKLALDLKNVTDMELLFFSKHADQWQMHAGSMTHAEGMALIPPTAIKTVYTTSVNQNRYMAIPIQLSLGQQIEVIAIAAKPIDKMIAPFKAIERMFFYLLIATIALSIVAIYVVTHKMVRPLNDFAHLDNLTNIGNRRLFSTMIDHAFIHMFTRNKPFAVLMLDLNKFKYINDTFGHDAGDIVLKETAKRIKQAIRNSDHVVRLGGDEFAIVVHDGSRTALSLIANKIYDAIAAPIQIPNAMVSVTTCIGIAIAPIDANNKANLMKCVDEAMYLSKLRNLPYAFFGDQRFELNDTKPT